MLRALILSLILVSQAQAEWQSDLPEVNALIHYQIQHLNAEGVTEQQSYSERWIRSGDNLWSERLIPEALRAAYLHQHDDDQHNAPHAHFEHQMAARWVRRQANVFSLHFADQQQQQLVFFPESEYGLASFTPDSSLLQHLFRPELLSQLSPTAEAAPTGAQWYQLEQGGQRVRLLWSKALQIPLSLERRTLDGYNSYQMTLELQPPLTAAQLPWQQLSGYQAKEISDFFD